MTRVVRVVTNETCELGCRFCNARRPHERADIAGAPQLRARLDQTLRGAPGLVTLTGGEPTLRKDLPAIVAYARARFAGELVLETHGLHLTPSSLAALVRAGLDTIRVHVPAWGDALDRFTVHPGAGQKLRDALGLICATPLRLETNTPMVADNLTEAPRIPEHLAQAQLRPAQLWFRVPTEAPDPTTVAPLRAGTAAAAAFVRSARRQGLDVGLDPAAFVPPCTFENPSAVAHVFALNPGARERPGYHRRPQCDPCVVQERCPGLPPGVDEPVRPLRTASIRRRLTVIGTPQAQIARELVTHEVYRHPDGSTLPAAIVRINFRCNQSCHFCFVSTHLPDPDPAAVEAEIDAIAARRGALALSGGEPTLNPRLLDYIRRAKQAGVAEVELQTNATRLHRDELAARLAEAGLDRAFISLHGSTAATSDAVTDAPGTHAQSVLGIDALSRTGVPVRLNFVLCETNYREFPGFVTQVAARWPRAAVNVSFVGPSTDLVPRTSALVPRYDDVMPFVSEGMRIAAASGLELGGFDSMCGVPLCLVPGDLRGFVQLADAQPGLSADEFVKPAACAQCQLRSRCFGLRSGYAQLHGTDELRPVSEVPSRPR